MFCFTPHDISSCLQCLHRIATCPNQHDSRWLLRTLVTFPTGRQEQPENDTTQDNELRVRRRQRVEVPWAAMGNRLMLGERLRHLLAPEPPSPPWIPRQ